MGKSKIEWTEHTWNPIAGCSLVSPGCMDCYAMRRAHQLQAIAEKSGGMQCGHYAGTTKLATNGKPVWTGKLALAEHKLIEPLRRQPPTVYFVNSMSDLFHEAVPDKWIDRVFATMALCPQHTFQVLTKRAERMREYLSRGHVEARWVAAAYAYAHSDGATVCVADAGFPLRNVWLGVSAERQKEADERIPHLLAAPAAIRFVSCEPLLGPLDLTNLSIQTASGIEQWNCLSRQEATDAEPGSPNTTLDQVIVGGESGPHARPMHPDWARDIRDQCARASVPFFFKQFGEWAHHKATPGGDLGHDVRHARVRIVHPSGRDSAAAIALETNGARQTEPGSLYMARVGKKAAGRLLDGVEHNDRPETRP